MGFYLYMPHNIFFGEKKNKEERREKIKTTMLATINDEPCHELSRSLAPSLI